MDNESGDDERDGSVAALHHGVPGQMPWLKSFCPGWRPGLRPGSLKFSPSGLHKVRS